jgi:hypothetical protein
MIVRGKEKEAGRTIPLGSWMQRAASSIVAIYMKPKPLEWLKFLLAIIRVCVDRGREKRCTELLIVHDGDLCDAAEL